MNRSLRPIGVIAALMMLLILGPGLAWAAEPDEAEKEEEEAADYARTGIYFGLNGVGAVDVDRRGPSNSTSGTGGLNARFGSRESETLAWELEFEWLQEGIYTYGINGKIFFNDSAFQPYVVLGAGGQTRKSRGSSRHTDWGFRMGAGADFYLTKHWALNSEFTYVVGVGDLLRREYGSFSLGAIYRF